MEYNGRKKSKDIFGENIKNYIYSNNLSRSEFANGVNANLTKMGIEKELDFNMIWTYDSRKSMPSDGYVLVAIAQFMGKPLEQLLTIEFARLELEKYSELHNGVMFSRIAQKDLSDNMLKPLPSNWDIDSLDQLTDEQENFLYDLIQTGIYNDNGSWYCFFDIAFRYKEDRSTATIYYGKDYLKEMVFQWTKTEYSLLIAKNDDSTIIKTELEKLFFSKFIKLGIVADFGCDSCSCDELPDERYRDVNGYYVSKVDFALKKEDIAKIMDCYLKKTSEEIGKLIEKDSNISWGEGE